jgi:hypothetical protein
MTSFPSLLVGLSTTAASFGAHWVLLFWAGRSFPVVAAKKRPLLVLCAAIATGPWLLRRVLLHSRSGVVDAIFAASMTEMMLVLAIALPLLALVGFSELARGRKRTHTSPDEVPREAEPSLGGELPIGRRGAIEKIGGVAVAGATGLAFGWGMTIGRHGYEVREIAVRIPGLPKSLDGYVIAQISDIHAGLFVGERELREGSELIRKVRPDLLVATGDLVDIDAHHAPALARPASRSTFRRCRWAR